MNQFARNFIFSRLSKLDDGVLNLYEGERVWTFGKADERSGLQATLKIHKPGVYQAIMRGGSLAAAELYVNNSWSCDDLTQLLRLFVRNQRSMHGFEKGFVKFTSLLRWLSYQWRRNNLRGSRRNIAEHYDLSNDFFALFLDKNLMYSSAIFKDPSQSLEEAATHKLDVICRKLRLKPGDKVIEIGSGWGGFALHAAQHYGCDIVTTTISKQQYELTKERIAEKNLGHRICLLQEDYRNLTGAFDKLVSIEMIEAVGHQYYNQFFAQCGKLLKQDGEMLIQAITIQDQAFERAKHEIDFIKRYIFPGSCIPSVTALLQALTKSSDLKLHHLEDIGLHYALTLNIWRERFAEKTEQIKMLGFDDRFIRLWQFYFCYCEAGFAEGYLGDVHLHAVKPQAIRLESYVTNKVMKNHAELAY
jgi:cyclopropane-fatty-acyl-phospholipid synthase